MKSTNTTLQTLSQAIRELFSARDWGKFHSPKNLAMNLMIESAELAEYFTWVSEEQSKTISKELKVKISEEMGDVFITLLNLSEKLEVDLLSATFDKIEKIKQKYPAAQYKGKEGKFSVHNLKAETDL